MVEAAARLAHDVAKLEFDFFKMGNAPRAAGGFKGAEQTIGMRNWVDQ